MTRLHGSRKINAILLILIALFAGACNLTNAPQQGLDLTDVPTITVLPSRTSIAGNIMTVTSLPVPTLQPGQQRPTSVVVLPATALPFPTTTPLPVSIVILSPIPGNIVAGNVQVLGAAIHPQFLQYQLEFGPDPNPSNLWYPASNITQTPVLNGLLGIWNTNTGASPDGIYQLRLRLYLRDGTSLATVVNSIRIQNQQPTPVPTATTVTIPRPIAAFTQDRATGQAPLVVRFTNQSSGNINQYNWDFGDGSSSTEINPTHTFRTPGVYSVRLRVRGPGGGSNVSREISVQSPSAPVAGFTQDKTSGESPLRVQFTDQSTGNITSRSWNFGDSSTSTEVSPAHEFTAVGTYNVILTVTGPGGSSSITRQITVQNPTIPAPLAALVPSATEGNAQLTVQFDASDPSGQIDSYNWNFGDGQTGLGQIVTHTFVDPGTYEVTLTVVGPGGQASAKVSINVTQPPDAPTASFTQDKTSGDIQLTVGFDASGSTGQIDSYNWNFGDGQTGTGAIISHTFTTSGTYTVELMINGPGGSDTASVNISATEPVALPSTAFDAVPTSGTAPLDVQFNNQTQGDGLSFVWDFGDGSTSSERDPLHRFENPGNYTVRLTATSSGGENSTEMTISISEAVVIAPPAASFTANPPSGYAPLAVQFDAAVADNIISYDWNFGDGIGVASGTNISYTYNNPGEYTIVLTVTSTDSQQDTEQMTIQVGSAPLPAPIASFTANPPSGYAPLAVQFDAAVADNIVSYDWNFGDGIGVANGTSVSYTYNNPGDFTAILTVTSSDGQQDTEQMTISVSQPSVPSDSIVQQTPIIPAFDQQNVHDALRAIYNNGLSQGKNPRVFAIIGDDQAVHGGYLDPFADPGLDVSASGLQSIVEWYQQADLGDGRSSFDRNGFAAFSGRRAQALLNPERSDPNNCNSGETPLDCELRLIQPSVAIVSVGYSDVINGTDVNAFRSTMEQIIQTLIGQGVIPIISTVQPVPGMEVQTEAINVAIIEAVRNVEAANGTSVPIYNLWRALNPLPNSGLSGDNFTPSTAPGGAGDLSADAAGNYGTNARNRDTLTILSNLHDQIFPDAQ